MNDVLYVFYTTTCSIASSYGYSTSTIYYRTVTVDTGVTGQDWKLSFSEKKSFAAGVSPVKIRMAQMMDETMYVIFSASGTWYSMSSVDGLHFGSKVTLFTASSLQGAGGTVFQVPDPNEGSLDRLMIAYADGGTTLTYYFFDGKGIDGPHTVSTGLSTYSVRLIAGSAKGYSNNSKYSIQVFIASPKDGSWAHIYHREYIPAGGNGNAGSWSSAWNHLALSGDDDIRCYYNYESERCWTVIPLYTSDSNDPSDIQMHLRIWYCKGTYWNGYDDYVKFRYSSYVSDKLVYDAANSGSTGPEKQDLSTETLLGVIEGTPPWPVNGGGGTADTSNTSWVEYGKTGSSTVETKWSVGGSVMGYFGQTYEKKGGWKMKFTAGVKYTKTSQTSGSASKAVTLKSYNDPVPGRSGWLVLLIPEIINDEYILKAYDGHALFYEGDPSGDEVTVNLITYGPDTLVDLKVYYLDNPSLAIGGDEVHSSRKLLEGMAARPFSNDIAGNGINTTGWLGVTSDYTQCLESAGSCPWEVKILQTKENTTDTVLKDLLLWSTAGESSAYSITYSTTEGETWSPSASFTATADKIGKIWIGGGELNVSWNMDISSTSTMTAKLGFQYNIPDCCSPTAANNYCAGYPTCYSTMEVVPKFFVPKADDTGYSSPWISNDIRNYGKPKPWCLTYYAYPNYSSPAPELSRLTVKQASATVHLDRVRPNRDRVSARLSLEGVGPDYSEQIKNLLHLSLGSYAIDSDINQVLSRSVQGNRVVLQMKQAGNPNSSIQVVLSYEKAKSLLNIALDADRVSMPGVAKSLVNAYAEGNAVAFPLGLFLGSRYYAQDTLDGHLTVNKRNITCELQVQR